MTDKPNGHREPVILLRFNPSKRGDRDPDMTGTWLDQDGPPFWASAWFNEKDGEQILRIVKCREHQREDKGRHPATVNPVGSSRPMNPNHNPNRSIHGTAKEVAAMLLERRESVPEDVLRAIREGDGDKPYEGDL